MSTDKDIGKKLTSYRTASAFLHAYYLDKKSTSKSWSFEYWSRKLKIKKTTLQKTVKGQIPMGDAIELALCKYFGFKKEEKKYFQLLAVNEKISKIYPDISIDFPEMNSFKINSFELKQPEALKAEALELMSMPDVQWLLTAFDAKGMTTNDLKKIEDSFHKGLRNINWKSLIDLCLKHKILVQEGNKVFFKFDEKLYLDAQITGMKTAGKRYLRTNNLMNKMLRADLEDQVSPATNNRAFCTRMDAKSIPEMLTYADKAMREMYALFSKADGDSIIDVQFFVSPVISLNKK